MIEQMILPESITFQSWKTEKICCGYLEPLQVTHPLDDRSLHVAAFVLQLAVFLAEVFLLLQEGGVAPCQFLLINLQDCELAKCFAQLSSDFLWVFLKSVQQVLIGKMGEFKSNRNRLRKICISFLLTYSLVFCSHSFKCGAGAVTHVGICAVQESHWFCMTFWVCFHYVFHI